MEMLFKIMKTDGLFLGLSSGVNLYWMVKLNKLQGYENGYL